jgi:hypothetical protein
VQLNEAEDRFIKSSIFRSGLTFKEGAEPLSGRGQNEMKRKNKNMLTILDSIDEELTEDPVSMIKTLYGNHFSKKKTKHRNGDTSVREKSNSSASLFDIYDRSRVPKPRDRSVGGRTTNNSPTRELNNLKELGFNTTDHKWAVTHRGKNKSLNVISKAMKQKFLEYYIVNQTVFKKFRDFKS